MDIIYEPFELYTEMRKRNQIEIIKNVIFELKKDFNKEFEDLEKNKEDSIILEQTYVRKKIEAFIFSNESN